MSDAAYYLKILSTFSVAFPILFCIWGRLFRKWPYILFFVFLLLGFLVDLAGWYLFLTKNSQANWIFRYGYSLVEPLFFFWWIGYFSQKRIIKKTTRLFMGASFLFWIFVVFNKLQLPTYYIFTEVSLAFFAGFLVLEIVEVKKEKLFPMSLWIAFGIFFYNLCTFFIKGLVNSQIALDLWFVQNIINITTNLIFALGFLVGRK